MYLAAATASSEFEYPDPADVRNTITRAAAKAYHEAVRVRMAAEGVSARADEAHRAGFDEWVGRARVLEADAAQSLALLVMHWCDRASHLWQIDNLPDDWEPCVLELDDYFYVVTPKEPPLDTNPRLIVTSDDSFQSGQYDQ